MEKWKCEEGVCSEEREWLFSTCRLLKDEGLFESSLDVHQFPVSLKLFGCANFRGRVAGAFVLPPVRARLRPPGGGVAQQRFVDHSLGD